MRSQPDLPVEHALGLAFVKPLADHFLEDNVEALGQTLFALAETLGRTRLVLDMAGVESVPMTGLAKLVALHRRVRAADGRLTLVNVTDRLWKLFEATCLDRILDVHWGPNDELRPQLSS